MPVSFKFPPAESDVCTGQHQSTEQLLISIWEISNAAARQGTAVGVSHYRNLERGMPWNTPNILLNGSRAAGNGSKQTLCPHRPTHRERED
ncbi:hypothetical protein QQF64_012330 [Cirrhinus molitorella]|uniref:Uncharacterized protein n=1 Tax=Cirrhinus molitorella TaxID=172907 RepID=A0ABR3LWA9_9TELE